MIIRLDEGWRVRRYDSMNFVIESLQEGGLHPVTKVQGRPKWVNEGFYSSLEACIRAIPVHVPQNRQIGDFTDAISRINGIADRIEERSYAIMSDEHRDPGAIVAGIEALEAAIKKRVGK